MQIRLGRMAAAGAAACLLFAAPCFAARTPASRPADGKRASQPARERGRGAGGFFKGTHPKIGAAVENFTVRDVEGRDVRLSDFKDRIFVMELGACT